MGYAKIIFVPICEDISGEVGSFVLDKSCTNELGNIPINTLVLDLKKEHIVADELGVEDAVM